MVIIGIFCVVLGLFAEYFWWLKDWWHPQTLTGTKIGLEDVILSFTLPGTSILVYKFFFRKDLDRNFELNKKIFFAATRRFAPVFIASFGIASLLFFVFHVHSAISTSAGMLLPIAVVLARRRDLFPAMFWTAILAILLAVPAYLVFIFFFPGIVETFWDFSQITGYKFLGIPVEDIAWLALGGFMMGGIVEYGFGYKLVDEKELS